ncbi:MAG: histidinol dehydrogenase [Candidatus Omnitrophica bacterium 4484_171]|nr:MAG: histidinol dehydrogenase [Candidatus Omnitrophica bacterium 4484_171]
MNLIRNISNLDKLLIKKRNRKGRVVEKVSRIIKAVKDKGDDALIEFTKKFDKVKLNTREIKVSESEISSAFNELNSGIISSIKSSIDNLYKFYRPQLPKPITKREENGKVLKVRYKPIERVGVYIPSGSAPLVSSVYMCLIPALVAGVKDIVMVSPPGKEKFLNPFILAVASMLKIKEIYKIGGAQAIAALAYGTKTVRKVDKIIGPGNDFVTEAKRQVFGEVGIDMLAGPSEVVIIATRRTNIDFVVADLEAQTEHKGGLGIVITNSKKIANELRKSKIPGFIIKARNLNEAADIANRIAPEHLEILTKRPSTLLKKINNCSAIFLGDNSPVALGDYTAGPSHVLPTGGTARFFSSLSVRDFLREVHIVNYTKKALIDELPVLEKIASLEGMQKHIDSVKKRLS